VILLAVIGESRVFEYAARSVKAVVGHSAAERAGRENGARVDQRLCAAVMSTDA
jgi:hypothetical protein